MILESQKDLLNGVRFHTHTVFNLFFAQIETKLLENFDVQSIPIIGFLRHRMSLTVIMHIDHFRKMMLHNFCHEHSVREVARNITLRSA